MRMKPAAAAIGILTACVMVQIAEAHPELKAAEPAADAATGAPKEIRLTFSEGLISKFSGVELKDQNGIAIETGPAAADVNDRKRLIVPLKSPLAPGQYTVDWHAVSDDTHRIKGSYSFKVAP